MIMLTSPVEQINQHAKGKREIYVKPANSLAVIFLHSLWHGFAIL